MKTLEDKLSALSPRRREKIEARATELIAEEMSLRDLRHAQQLTQEKLAESLGMGQEGISRLEKRTDLLLSTLRGYVKALGGDLELVARFPNRAAVVLTGLAHMEADNRRAPKSSASLSRGVTRRTGSQRKRRKRERAPA